MKYKTKRKEALVSFLNKLDSG